MIYGCGEGKRKAHKSSVHFSINYKYRRNQMSLQYSEPAFASLHLQFDAFLFQNPESLSPVPSALPSPHLALETEVLTAFQAKMTLQRLMERGRLGGERKNWKGEETSYLLFLVERYCQARQVKSEQLTVDDWQCISQLVPNRTASACQFRLLSLRPASISRVPWSSQEGQLLHRIIQNQKGGTVNWRSVSEQLYQLSEERHFRTGKQCREHYSCFLKPDLKKGAWTDEEDYLLASLFLRLGRRWSKMAKLIEGRNENAIKNRFFLMFQNHKDTRLSSPDLLKMVRRRKEKIERRILPQEEKNTQEHTVLPNSDSSHLQFSPVREPDLQTMPSTIQSEIFIAEPAGFALKAMEEHQLCREEFQRYIDF